MPIPNPPEGALDGISDSGLGKAESVSLGRGRTVASGTVAEAGLEGDAEDDLILTGRVRGVVLVDGGVKGGNRDSPRANDGNRESFESKASNPKRSKGLRLRAGGMDLG
jgi:hypothetical protein